MGDILVAKGVSSTGSEHSLEIEPIPTGFKFTVLGHNGKRHASVKLSKKDREAIVAFLTAER